MIQVLEAGLSQPPYGELGEFDLCASNSECFYDVEFNPGVDEVYKLVFLWESVLTRVFLPMLLSFGVLC